MPITLTRLDPTGEDHAALVDFLTRNEFPFHVNHRPSREYVESAIARGAYRDEDNDSFWLEHTVHGRIGFLRLEDLSENSPLFDLRIDAPFRNRGLGAEVLRAVTSHVFTTLPEVHRFEGQTREDNAAMRTIFLRCGWVKEAHYRESWPVDGGPALASVAYAVLRRDWETGRTTPLVWDDFPG